MCDFQCICCCAASAMFIAHWPKLVFRSSIFTNLSKSVSNFNTNSIPKSVLFFTILFINLLTLPKLSDSFRVPYRYPHYPLFHKELIQNSPGMYTYVIFAFPSL